MHCATVLYPRKEGGSFDFDYYTNKHVPMVAKLLGASIEVRKGLSAPNGSSAAFACIGTIWIESLEKFQSLMAKHSSQIMSDIPNYTNIDPIIQLDEIVVQTRSATL
jgi:uncharacterized protein (TIGR02118 family)